MSGMGTGVIIDPRGYIVTNYHVIEDVSSLRVTLVDGATYAGEVLAHDPQSDLALVKIEPLTPLTVMPMGTAEDLMHGETVVAIGNAYGYEHTVTQGIVSELHRDVRLSETQAYRNLIQTDASINPGNSGGPLINIDGEMIGLNVAIRAGAQGIGFAIPVEDVKHVAAKLLDTRKLRGIWHGISYRAAANNESQKGKVVIKRAESGSPAEAAGLQSGDRLISVGDMPIEAEYDVERAFLDKGPTEEIVVLVARGKQERRCRMMLQAPSARETDSEDWVWRRLGLRFHSDVVSAKEVRQVSAQLNGGLRITDVAENGAVSKAGIKSGDILVGLHQWETLNPQSVAYVLRQPQIEQLNPIRFFVIRNSQIQRGWLTVPTED